MNLNGELKMKATNKALKVVGYVRVSTEEQAVDGVSLAAQRAKLVAYASLYDLDLVEIVELKDHPFFMAVQFHPEFKSKPDKAHPLFREFIKATLKNNR